MTEASKSCIQISVLLQKLLPVLNLGDCFENFNVSIHLRCAINEISLLLQSEFWLLLLYSQKS